MASIIVTQAKAKSLEFGKVFEVCVVGLSILNLSGGSSAMTKPNLCADFFSHFL